MTPPGATPHTQPVRWNGGSSVVPEATYQAWFAHYLISQFGIDRVAREPIFRHRDFKSPRARELADRLRGGEIKLDAVVTLWPGVELGHYAARDGRDARADRLDAGGLDALRDLAVISELKVAATQTDGFGITEIVQDIAKLEMLLAEADRLEPAGGHVPLAFMCVLDNHPRKRSRLDATKLDGRAEQSLGLCYIRRVHLLHATLAKSEG